MPLRSENLFIRDREQGLNLFHETISGGRWSTRLR
jgi:hypothetical protein